MKRRLVGGWVVRWTGAAHEVLEGACVVLGGDRVEFVGFPDDPRCPPADEDVHLPGRLISPGLVNLHCIANVDLQPLRIDVTGVGFPKSVAWFESGEQVLSDDQLRTSARFAVASLLRNGSTTFAGVTTMASKRFEDPQVEPIALAQAAMDLGARGYVGHNFQDHSRYHDAEGREHLLFDAEAGREGLRKAVALVEWLAESGGDRVNGFLFPYTTETCSDDLLRTAGQVAADLGVTLRSHFAQYPKEALGGFERTGKSPVERMEGLGLLGPATTLTHAIFLRGHPDIGHGDAAQDLKLLADSGTNVAHCPVVFSRRGELLRSFDSYRRAGINIGLGTDTVPADIVGEMRIGATMAKVAEGDAGAGSARDFFHAATVGGATALGRNDLGRLAPGAKADVSVFDLRSLQLGVIDCPIKALVHYASGADAEHVFVDGSWVVRDRDVVAVDDEALLQAAQSLWGDYKEGLAARDPQCRPADKLYPPAYPVRAR